MKAKPARRSGFFNPRVRLGIALCSLGFLLGIAALSEVVTSGPNLISAALKPTIVVQGTPALGTVMLDTPAPAGGVAVVLVSINSAVATVPGLVMVPQGATSANFTVTTSAVSVSTEVTIQASYKGVTISPKMTVTPRVAVRGVSGDLWADVVIGKPNFGDINPNQVTADRLFPQARGDAGLSKGESGTMNQVGPSDLNSPNGVAVSGGQLIVTDHGRILFWNNTASLTNGQPADGYAGDGITNFQDENGTDYRRLAADKGSHLWLIDNLGEDGLIDVYSLPLTTGAMPFATLRSPLPVLGGGTLSWDFNLTIGGITPAGTGTKVWVTDPVRNRVFRISNPLTSPVVDIVLGQTSLAGTLCNQGNSGPSQTSLCTPGSAVLDPAGNLYVSDASLEVSGNLRLLEFDASLFPDNPLGPLFGLPATRVFGRNGSFTDPNCDDQLCGPLQPAFTSDGQMVVGMIGYIGSRFPLVYTNPLASQTPDTYLNDLSSNGGYSAVFDSHDDLYVADPDRGRVLVYRRPLTIGGSPAVSLSPTTLTFSGQSVGTQSIPKPIILSNTGNRTLIISSIATSGDFSQTNTCGSSVAVGADCVVNVTFTPAKKGTRTGALTITDNATGSPHSVTLTGAGIVKPAPGDTALSPGNNPVPTVISLSPDNQTAGGMDFTLTVSGTNFVDTSTVQWNGSDRATTFVNSTTLTAAITASDIVNAGIASVAVTNPPPGGGTSNSIDFTINNPVPSETALLPSSKTAGDSAFTLVLTGAKFVSTSVVQWNGSARPTTFYSDATITAAITAADIANAGTASVTVTNPPPGGGTSNSVTFTINNPEPTETSLSPSSETAGDSAFTLTVTGTQFVSTSVVQWNGSARPTTFLNSTTLAAAISAADIANGGTVVITVMNPAPGGGTSSELTFTINNPVPTATSLSPSSATAGGAQFTLTVNGTGFVPDSVVKWKSTALTTTFVNSTKVTAIVPASNIATAGTATVTISNPAPGGGTSGALTFTINNPVPTATTLTPSTKLAGGSAFTLKVTGTNFVATSKVQWNGHNRTTTFVNSTTLNASILDTDIAQGGTASVTVFNPTPGGGTSNGLTFTTTNPVPQLTTLSPNNATAGGAKFLLTVNGTNFVKASAINWNGTALSNPKYVSSTQLTVTVPAENIANAGTASVTVTNPAPGGGTSNAVTFAINNPVPNLTSLSPTSKKHGGTDFTLTVHGTGFVSSSQVKWNGSNRTTTFVRGSQVQAAITAADIANVGTAQVTVTNPGPGGGTSNSLTFTIN